MGNLLPTTNNAVLRSLFHENSRGLLGGNTRSQATVRREVRRRSNLPRAVQRRLGFKVR